LTQSIDLLLSTSSSQMNGSVEVCCAAIATGAIARQERRARTLSEGVVWRFMVSPVGRRTAFNLGHPLSGTEGSL